MTTQATAAKDKSTADEETTETTDETSRLDAAHLIVRHNVYWALGAGLVPIPVADFFALTAVQVKMLKELTNHYHLRFFDDAVKKIIGSLIASTGSLAIGGMLARSFVKLLPGLGQAVGLVAVPVLAGALTQAIGNVFIMHFESGGTLLNFDVEKMRDHFQKELVSAKESVKQVHAEKKSAKHASP